MARTFGWPDPGPVPGRRCRSTPRPGDWYHPARTRQPRRAPTITVMIESVGRRLRIVFGRVRSGATLPDPSEATGPAGQELEFVAYGEDCLLSGQVRMSSDRLTDMLNEHDEYVLGDVLLERLDDGAGVELKEVLVMRDDLLLVHATGPRGNAERRHRTRPYPVAMKIGPYHLRGLLHGSPGRDPDPAAAPAQGDGAADRRQHRLPVRHDGPAPVGRRRGGQSASRSTGSCPPSTTMPAMPDLPELPADAEPGPLLKDFTGALFDLERDPPHRGPRRYASSVTDTGPRTSADAAERPARRAARHRRARPSSPGRTARCSWATWAPRSIKVEPPEGDVTRGWGPPWIGGDGGAGAATAHGGLLPGGQPQQARPPSRPQDAPRARRSCAA